MGKLNVITLLFNFFAIIYTLDISNQANHVLPLVFFLKSEPDSTQLPSKLHLPDSLDNNNVVTNEGRIVNGTKFTSRTNGEQMFFCPNENPGENCLVPREFQDLDPLECAKEPEPVISMKSATDQCGPDEVGKSREFVYKFCPGCKPYEMGIEEVQIYEFCYDETNKKTLFTSHFIMFPELLRSDALLWEREVEYVMKTYEGYTPSNYEEFQDAIEEAKAIKTLSFPDEMEQREYQVQKLIPEEDMAFALWRKPTSQFLNVEWQHAKLIPLWKQVNDLIRQNAQILFGAKRTRIYVKTGVFQLSSVTRSDGQLSNVWVKIIHTMPEITEKTVMSGVAIMMNNFIENVKQPAILNQKEAKIEDYCDDNLCSHIMENAFLGAGGKVLCCPLNNKIRGLFGGQDDISIPTLYIPGIIKPLPGKVVIG